LEIGTRRSLLVLLQAGFRLDPEREFFGLGNNDLPPDDDELSTELLQRTDLSLTAGWRPTRRLALNASVGLRYVSVRRGTRDGDIPFTLDRFPISPVSTADT
jgi:hypothetical protein